jgi:hypothetical protein
MFSEITKTPLCIMCCNEFFFFLFFFLRKINHVGSDNLIYNFSLKEYFDTNQLLNYMISFNPSF